MNPRAFSSTWTCRRAHEFGRGELLVCKDGFDTVNDSNPKSLAGLLPGILRHINKHLLAH